MPRPADIREVAGQLRLEEWHLALHGRHRAKLALCLLSENASRRGKYAFVSVITSALAGDIMTMPGLPSHPRATQIDLSDAGRIIGLV